MTAPARRRVRWFSGGAASAVATKLDLLAHPGGVVARCHTGAEHEDNDRFAADCAKWFGREIITLRSEEYRDTWDVWERRRFMAGIHGAPCTSELKLAPRLAFQRPDDIHVMGYTADASDRKRAQRFAANFFELTAVFPLVERGIDKATCLGMLEGAGIAPPLTYALGLPNANCIPCVKATSPAYWALIRLRWPEQFERAAKLSRELGARLARIENERVFIDEIPADWPVTAPMAPRCDFLCQIDVEDMGDPT
jgi:hypothetical protein